jgi:hypothetical protein
MNVEPGTVRDTGTSRVLEAEDANAASLRPVLERIAVALQALARVQRNTIPISSSALSYDIRDHAAPMKPAYETPSTLEGQITEILDRLKREDRLVHMVERSSYTVEEVAQLTRFKPWTIRHACNTGRIKANKGPDGKWRVSHAELRKLQDEGLPPPHREIALP